jgi:hypothetical protein
MEAEAAEEVRSATASLNRAVEAAAALGLLVHLGQYEIQGIRNSCPVIQCKIMRPL